MTEPITLAAEGYDELAIILRDAFLQASEGKGAERHANSKPFHEQPMQAACDILDSDSGLAYQVIKKVREGSKFTEFTRFEREMLGAINYIAGMIIWRRKRLPDAVQPPMTFKERCAEIDAGIREAFVARMQEQQPQPPVDTALPPVDIYAQAAAHIAETSPQPRVIGMHPDLAAPFNATTPTELPDMSDPANWLPGDMVMAVNSTSNQFTNGMFYELRDQVDSVHDSVRVAKDDTGHPNGWGFYNFVWHSRPTK